MISCCDPGKLPRTDALVDPNRHQLVNGAWKGIDIKHPSVIIPVTEGSTFYAVPGNRKTAVSASQAEYYPSRGGYLFLHAPGPWYIYNDSGSDQSVIILDAYNAIGLLFYAGIRIVGSGGTADVRNADADADFGKTLLGLLTNSRTAFYSASSADWLRWQGSIWSSAEGGSAATDVPRVAALLTGRDLVGGGNGVLRLIEARPDFEAISDSALNKLLVAASLQARIATGSYSRRVTALEETSSGGAGIGDYQVRESGYWGGLRSRRYTLCLPATVIAQTGSSFSATAPVILFVNPSTNEVMIRKVRVHWIDAITVATTRVRFLVDPDNRYSSGGVSGIPTGGFKSTNRDSTAGTAFTPTQWRYNDGITAIVATAADDDEYFYGDLAAEDTEPESVWEPKDDVIVPPSGTFAMYGWDGGGTDFTITVEIEVANVQ